MGALTKSYLHMCIEWPFTCLAFDSISSLQEPRTLNILHKAITRTEYACQLPLIFYLVIA